MTRMSRIFCVAIYLMCVLSAGAQLLAPAAPHHKAMMFADTTRVGVPFAKDPHVVDFGGAHMAPLEPRGALAMTTLKIVRK